MLDFVSQQDAIDHHSHASLFTMKDGTYRSIQEYSRNYNIGYLEAKLTRDVFVQYVRARNAEDEGTLSALDARYGIEMILTQGGHFRSTTAWARARAKGIELLYGQLDDDESVHRVGAEWRARGSEVLWDHALKVAKTPIVLTEVATIDRAKWDPSRYRQIIQIDPYLYPLGHDERHHRGYDADRFIDEWNVTITEQLGQLGVVKQPATLDEWIEFVFISLNARLEAGAIGFKLISAYVRTLQFDPVDRVDAIEAYTHILQTGTGDRKLLADYLLHQVAKWGMDRHMPLQIHIGMGHPEPGLLLQNANPVNLESFLLAPELNGLSVILIHGGYPFTNESAAMAQAYGNVYLDFSWMPYMHNLHLRQKLGEWMEILPANKLMFGTDAGMPEFHAAASYYAREALNAALLDGVSRGSWTWQQTEFLAERLLYSNTAELYGIR